MTIARTAATATGATLAVLVRGLAAVRRPPKPMHPHGHVRAGRLHRLGSEPPTGVAFLDEGAADEVVVRESRAIGLPASWPDVHGLAVRVPLLDGQHGDLLLSTTGSGRVTRHLLTLSRTQESGRLSTLVPFRTAAGPVVVAARYLTPSTVELAWAARAGRGARSPSSSWPSAAPTTPTWPSTRSCTRCPASSSTTRSAGSARRRTRWRGPRGARS